MNKKNKDDKSIFEEFGEKTFSIIICVLGIILSHVFTSVLSQKHPERIWALSYFGVLYFVVIVIFYLLGIFIRRIEEIGRDVRGLRLDMNRLLHRGCSVESRNVEEDEKTFLNSKCANIEVKDIDDTRLYISCRIKLMDDFIGQEGCSSDCPYYYIRRLVGVGGGIGGFLGGVIGGLITAYNISAIIGAGVGGALIGMLIEIAMIKTDLQKKEKKAKKKGKHIGYYHHGTKKKLYERSVR